MQGLYFSVGKTTRAVYNQYLSKTIRIGDIQYNMYLSFENLHIVIKILIESNTSRKIFLYFLAGSPGHEVGANE